MYTVIRLIFLITMIDLPDFEMITNIGRCETWQREV